MTEAIYHNGRIYLTGNLVPARRKCTVSQFAKSYTKTELKGLLEDKSRAKARRLFPEEWIYNQGAIGSCNGCAGAKALQRARRKAGLEFVNLSGEFLYSRICGGVDAGSMLDDGMYWMQKHGVAPWSRYHSQRYKKKYFTQEDETNAARFKAVKCFGTNNELEFATGIALGFIGVVAVHANNDFMQLDANGISHYSQGPGNHAVGIDDAEILDGEIVYDCFNSWGRNWGDNGRTKLTWKRHLAQPNKHHAFYLVQAVTDDTEDEIKDLK